MAEYIEREALFKKILSISVQVMGVRGGKTWFYEVLKLYREKVFEYIKEAPTADVVEARHSEWKQVVFDDGAKSCKCCMACGMFVEPKYNYKYCPGCGAKMDGKVDSNER